MGDIHDIKDGFGDLTTDKPVEVDIDGKTLELDMRVDDLHPVMTLGEMENPSEGEIEKLTETLKHVLYRSYLPYWDEGLDQEMDGLSEEQQSENDEAKQYIENLLLRHYLDIFVGIMEDLGWAEDEMMGEHPTMNREDFRSNAQ